MTIAYIVSAYKLPRQLVRLVRRLRDGDSNVVVHVDQKTDPRVYEEMLDGVRDLERVDFVDRHVCHWGGFGHVRATLKGIQRLDAEGIPFDYLVVLTGQDYPLRRSDEIERTLAEAGGRSFMNYWPLPHEGWDGRGGLDRIEHTHLVLRRGIHLELPRPRRRLPDHLVPWGGGPYWCLSRLVVDHVREYVRKRPEVVRFFERVWIPDELFFQTIVLNSSLRDTLVNDNLRYIDWARTPAPGVLRSADLDGMLSSGKLFARKFDETVDGDVLDLLDRRIDGGEHAL
jgi:Core-2/I-Branching enzyme